MKNILLSIAILFTFTLAANAQEENKREQKNRKFSHEEFQKKQREYITEHAKLTDEEAEKFFPLFFELQKQKWEINHKAHRKFKKRKEEKHTDEQCEQIVREFAETKVKIALLEGEFINKYLEVIPARKIMDIHRAEDMFQRYLLKRMSQRHERKQP